MARDQHQSNNFDAIRLLAAGAVVVGHAWPLTGTPGAPELGGIKIFHLAVFAFFSLSGYLVMTSWKRDPRPLPFLVRRSSRIFPGLALLVVVTILVIGPIATTLPLSRYFGSPATWSYLQNLTLVADYTLPGVFAEHPRPVVNGSLWTLGPEFICYLGVLAVGVVSLVVTALRRAGLSALVFCILAVALAVLSVIPGALPSGLQSTTEAMAFFAVGATFAHVKIFQRPMLTSAVLTILWMVGASLTDVPEIVWAWIAFPYIVIAIGSASWVGFRTAGRFGDLSYGCYLWGFPIQQIVILWFPELPLPLSIAVTLVLVFAVAFLSWHLVEARALRAGRAWANHPRLG